MQRLPFSGHASVDTGGSPLLPTLNGAPSQKGRKEAKTWSCKSIKQAMGGSGWGGGGRGHEKQTINPKSISTAAEASSPGVHSAVMSSRGGLRVTLEPVPGTVLHQHSTESFPPFIHFLSPILSAILSTLILWVACQPTGT